MKKEDYNNVVNSFYAVLNVFHHRVAEGTEFKIFNETQMNANSRKNNDK